MRDRVHIRVKTIVLMLLLGSRGIAIAQTTDSTIIIGNTKDQYAASPVERSGKPFYDIFKPDQKGIRPVIMYSRDDRIFAGVHYIAFNNQWVPDSAGHKHQLYTHYSIEQKAFSVGYKGIFNRVIGQWNLFFDADYDWVKWMNFYGFGNETQSLVNDNNFYRLRTKEASVSASLNRRIGKQSYFTVTPFYQRVQLIHDLDRYWSKAVSPGNGLNNYDADNFGGVRADLQLQNLDDLLLPTKGFVFTTGVAHTRNLSEAQDITNYTAYTRFFIPFLNHFVLSVENGAAALTGQPQFYQLNGIGGNTLRGFRRDRFFGETIYHNNNELQYLFSLNSRHVDGKMGFLLFADQGRVWKRGEVSNEWHYGYGGGIILVPYYKVYLSAQYGISKERKGFHFEFRRAL